MDLKQIANTPVFKEVLVEKYQNGQLIGSGRQNRLNVSGLGTLGAAAVMVLVLVTLGLTFAILAPFYSVYLLKRFLEAKRIEALEKNDSVFAPLKLQWHARIRYPADGWFNRLFSTLLFVGYAVIALLVWVQLLKVFEGQSVWIALAPYWHLMLFMFVSSTFLSFYLSPIKQQESAFQLGVLAFEQRFPGTLVDMAKDARQVMKKHGKKSREYRAFVEQATESAIASMQDAGMNHSDIHLYAGMLYQFLNSIKGRVNTLPNRPVTLVTLSLVILAAGLAWQQYPQYQATEKLSELLENYVETESAYSKAQALVAQGANPNAHFELLDSDVAAIITAGRQDVLEQWLSLGVRMNPWPMYQLGKIQDETKALAMTKLLQQHGGDLNTQGKEGQTLLHSAVRNGHEALVTYLIKQGVAVNPVWREWRLGGTVSQTPLDIAQGMNTYTADNLLTQLKQAGGKRAEQLNEAM